MDDSGRIWEFAEGAVIPKGMIELTLREAGILRGISFSRRKLKLKQMRIEKKAMAKRASVAKQIKERV